MNFIHSGIPCPFGEYFQRMADEHMFSSVLPDILQGVSEDNSPNKDSSKGCRDFFVRTP